MNQSLKNTFEGLLDFRIAADESLVLQIVDGVLDDVEEGDQQAPRLRADDDDALEEDADDDFLDLLLLVVLAVLVELKEGHGEEVCVVIGEAELVGARVDHDGAELVRVRLSDQVLEDLQSRGVDDGPRARTLITSATLLLALFGLNKTDVKNEAVDEGDVPLSGLRILELLDQSRSEEFFFVLVVILVVVSATSRRRSYCVR